jgi:hypothetical protein
MRKIFGERQIAANRVEELPAIRKLQPLTVN